MEKLQRLIGTAKGDFVADFVLKNAKVFNVFTGEFIAGDVAIVDGVVAGVGTYKGHKEFDLSGKYLTPGFIDGHIHIESSMLSPSEFARAVVPTGTTTIVADPHEIANVAGLDGIQYILDATENLPLTVYVMLPSCVPASNFENAGAQLEAEDLVKFIEHPRVLGLGEVMNYPGVIQRDEAVMKKLIMAKPKVIDGHAPGVAGNDMMAYAAAGIRSDHECVEPTDALERLRAGIHVMMREGSAAKNLRSLLPTVNRHNAQFFMFATDDRHPADLMLEGHINHMVKIAIEEGIDVATALQMATINTARYFKLDHVGAIAPGYQADILAFDDLEKWEPRMVIQKGELVAEQKRALFAGQPTLHETIKQTVHLAPIEPEKLRIPANSNRARVIGLVPNQIITEERIMNLTPVDGAFVADITQDVLKLVVFERHHALGNIAAALVHGFGLQTGAIASTIAHDSHNLIVIGSNDEDILVATKELERIQGGIAIVQAGKVLGSVAMPIAGLMSDKGADEVAACVENLKNLAHALGVKDCYEPFLTLAFLSLPVIPALKLTDRGLVDSKTFKFVPVSL